MFSGFLSESIIKRAQEKGLAEIEIVDLRKWGIGKHKQVDDTPYGGGAGMVLRPDVVINAIRDVSSKFETRNPKQIRNTKSQVGNRKSKIILLSPQGKTFNQGKAQELANGMCDLILVCGHYEGFDERIRDYVDEEISIGDYILTGGELAAAVVTDAVVRLFPGVLGKDESSQKESFSYDINRKSAIGNHKLLEYPQYTRPEEFEGKEVPEVLKSGNHAEIEKWREEQAIERTKKRRPDILKSKSKG